LLVSRHEIIFRASFAFGPKLFVERVILASGEHLTVALTDVLVSIEDEGIVVLFFAECLYELV